jgi:symplekin
MRWQLPHLSDAEAAAAALQGAGGGTTWELPDEDFLPLEKLKGRCIEDVATLMLRSMAPSAAKFALPVNVPMRVEQLRGDLFKGAVCVPKDRVWLYLALCIKRPVLLHELVETFTLCDPDMKEHLVNSIEEAIKYIPASEPEVLSLVRKATPETERLVLKVLHILMQANQGKDGQPLSPEYGEAVTRLYGATQNPRLLVPVFDLLDRKNLLDFLPAVLQLEEEEVTNAFRQLVRSRSPPLSISELLTELHHMNTPAENIVPVKCSMQALNILFAMREQFDPKVYGIVVQSLVEEPGRLPTLFMRTVIQVVKELPRLADFVVVEILPRLARQEVLGDDNMRRGFMIVLQHTFASQPAGAARVLTMLPITQLEDVLVQHPDWKAPLLDYASRQPAGVVPPHVRQLLQ